MKTPKRDALRTASRTLCAHLANATFEDLPAKAVHEARRGLLDWLGCALAGSRHPTIDKLIDVLHEVSGTIGNPMSDAAIEAKFLANAEPAIGPDNAHRLAEGVWKLDMAADIRALITLAA